MPTGGNRCVNGVTRSSRGPVGRRNAAASIDEAIGKHFPLQNLLFFLLSRRTLQEAWRLG
jgi:hypothetical protein